MISNRLGHFRDVIVEYLLPLVIHRKLWGIGWFDARLSKKKRKRSDSEAKEERESSRAASKVEHAYEPPLNVAALDLGEHGAGYTHGTAPWGRHNIPP